MHNPKQSAALVVGLLQARTIAHVIHLRTRSYAEHMAMGDFYGAVGDQADALCETLQGRYDLLPLELVDMAAAPTGTDPVAYLRELSTWLDANRACCSDSDVQNQLDEVASLIARTLYKLRMLA